MKSDKQPLFLHVDCIRVYVPDLRKGMEYYHNFLGMPVIWRTATAIGLGMADNRTEIVIQNENPGQETDIKVNSVIEAVQEIKKAGGQIIFGPFDIRIGKCAVIKDPWGNECVILDDSKGSLLTDSDGNIIGQNTVSRKDI